MHWCLEKPSDCALSHSPWPNAMLKIGIGIIQMKLITTSIEKYTRKNQLKFRRSLYLSGTSSKIYVHNGKMTIQYLQQQPIRANSRCCVLLHTVYQNLIAMGSKGDSISYNINLIFSDDSILFFFLCKFSYIRLVRPDLSTF